MGYGKIWTRWIWRGAGHGTDDAARCRSKKRSRHRLLPAVLGLEDRRLLTFHVTSIADDGTTGTLRWAVQQADVATSPSTIDFRLGNAPATITLASELELSNTAEPITIDGSGANLLGINGNTAGSVFQIDPQVTASLSGLTIGGSAADQVWWRQRRHGGDAHRLHHQRQLRPVRWRSVERGHAGARPMHD